MKPLLSLRALTTLSIFLSAYKLLLLVAIVLHVLFALLGTLVLWFLSVLSFVFLQIFPTLWLDFGEVFASATVIHALARMTALIGAFLLSRWYWKRSAQKPLPTWAAILICLIGLLSLTARVNGM